MYFGPTESTLRISLNDVTPDVWRHIVVPSSILLPELSRVLETVMGWEGYHLHQFVVADILFGAPNEDDDWSIDYRKVTLQQISRQPGSTFEWHYDFGDGWVHSVEVQAVGEPDPERATPVVLGGARACPPEDCGGPWGYAELLEAIADPDHEQHDELIGWVGAGFDPDAFDVGAVNRRLAPQRKEPKRRR